MKVNICQTYGTVTNAKYCTCGTSRDVNLINGKYICSVCNKPLMDAVIYPIDDTINLDTTVPINVSYPIIDYIGITVRNPFDPPITDPEMSSSDTIRPGESIKSFADRTMSYMSDPPITERSYIKFIKDLFKRKK